ncbi:response regulator, partial [Pseudoalteromonas sp. MER144-MNA-CIBAN-0113]|uniref:response regulator n=1 Tax=Pseudoalteromonas sp. MER144-MNA-CIBAN-0113 TaxID=3140429 RepID=UPI00331A5D5E
MDQSISQARILIVDDEPANLKVMREVLASNYRLSFAKSGAVALQLIENDPPKLILLDVMMPDTEFFKVVVRFSRFMLLPEPARFPAP